MSLPPRPAASTRVRFEVRCPSTRRGQRVGICGSSEELGWWDPDRCLELATDVARFPVWAARGVVEVDPTTRYKLVLLTPGGGSSAQWEEGGDRELPQEAYSHECVKVFIEFGSDLQIVSADELAEVSGPEELPSGVSVGKEERAPDHVGGAKESAAHKIPGLAVQAGQSLEEPEGEPSHRACAPADLLVAREEKEEALKHEAVGGSCDLTEAQTQDAPKVDAPASADAALASADYEGLVQDAGVWLTEDHAALCASAEVALQRVRERSAGLGVRIGGVASDRPARFAAISAMAGGAAVGAGGAAAGLAVGSLVGAACGLLPAAVTFGLSIPVGAVLGGGVGLGLGAVVGVGAGAAGGGAVGYGLARREEAREGIGAEEKPEHPE